MFVIPMDDGAVLFCPKRRMRPRGWFFWFWGGGGGGEGGLFLRTSPFRGPEGGGFAAEGCVELGLAGAGRGGMGWDGMGWFVDGL